MLLLFIVGLLFPAGVEVCAQVDLATLEGIPNVVWLGTDVIGGGTPNEDALKNAAKQGIRAVIDLRMPAEGLAVEKRLAAKYGLKYYNIPTTPRTLGASQVTMLTEVLADDINRPALLYCASGNRVGKLWALYNDREK